MSHDAAPGPPGSPARLVLASASPRRHELLARLRLTFDVVAADVDETPRGGESPIEYVRRVALAKSDAVGRPAGAVFVAADTTIELDGAILGKPRDRDDAVAMLLRLAGRRHEVHTAVVVRYDDGEGERHDVDVVTTGVEMAAADRQLIEWYVATGEPLGKAGSYALQGAGDLLIARVDGSVSNVIGLPLAKLVAMLGAVPARPGQLGR